MDDRTSVQKVRDSLAGADKARADARRYGRMHEATRGFGFPKRVKFTRMRIWAWRNLIQPWSAEVELDEREIDMLSNWFYERQQAELKRAEYYEQEALRVANPQSTDTKEEK